MAAGFSTLAILDGGGTSRLMRVWDEGGPGPYTFTSDYPGSDGSGTITAGGTAQNLFSGSIPKHGFLICNLDVAETLWFSPSTTAAANTIASIPIAPLGTFVCPIGMVPFAAISVVAATTGHKFTALQW